jgi:hypothetical protein
MRCLKTMTENSVRLLSSLTGGRRQVTYTYISKIVSVRAFVVVVVVVVTVVAFCF